MLIKKMKKLKEISEQELFKEISYVYKIDNQTGVPIVVQSKTHNRILFPTESEKYTRMQLENKETTDVLMCSNF